MPTPRSPAWRCHFWSRFFQISYPKLGLPELAAWHKLLMSVGITTATWITVTLLTRPTDTQTLEDFYKKIRPNGPGWSPVRDRLAAKGIAVSTEGSLTYGIAAMVASTFLVYSLLLGVGYLLYGQIFNATLSLLIAVVATFVIAKLWPKLGLK